MRGTSACFIQNLRAFKIMNSLTDVLAYYYNFIIEPVEEHEKIE